jgi:hypothetical protein
MAEHHINISIVDKRVDQCKRNLVRAIMRGNEDLTVTRNALITSYYMKDNFIRSHREQPLTINH